MFTLLTDFVLRDEVLVKNTLSGDKTAFNRLIEKYQSRVYGLAYHITGNFADAEDLTQEAFIRAYLDLHQLREPKKFANWLYKLTRNICRMWIRKQASNSRTLEFLQDAVERQSVPSPAEQVERAELQDSVRDVIAALPEDERLIVTLYYLDGLTYRGIADFMGVSQSTVKRRLRTSRKKLKEELIIMVQDSFQEHKPTPEFTEKVSRKIDSLVGILGIGQPNLAIEFLAVGNNAVPALVDVMSDESQSIEKLREAANIVGRFGDEEAFQSLLTQLSDPDDEVRRHATVILGQIGNKDAIEPLTPLLEDEKEYVRLAAVNALGKLGYKKVMPELIDLLENGSKFYRSEAAKALACMGDEGLKYVEKALNDSDMWVRWGAVFGLRLSGNPKAVELLESALNDEHPVIRRYAASALNKVTARGR